MRIDITHTQPRDRSRTFQAKRAAMSRREARKAKAFARSAAWN